VESYCWIKLLMQSEDGIASQEQVLLSSNASAPESVLQVCSAARHHFRKQSLPLHRPSPAHTDSPLPIRPRPNHSKAHPTETQPHQTQPDPTRAKPIRPTHLLLHQLHLRKTPILGPRRPALSPIPIDVQREKVACARVASVGISVCWGSAGFALPIRGEARARPAGLGEEQRVCAVSGVALALDHSGENVVAVGCYGRDDM
jgi:hypothetical protein